MIKSDCRFYNYFLSNLLYLTIGKCFYMTKLSIVFSNFIKMLLSFPYKKNSDNVRIFTLVHNF